MQWTLTLTTFWWNSCLKCFLWPQTPLSLSTHANLYSDIKPDDSPVKGPKRGKGKKEKKKDPFEKKKPKLEELKVLSPSELKR